MTYEQAVFFKILLSLGYREELNAFINTALEAEEPLSDIILELSFAENDLNRQISLLNEYIIYANTAVDYDGAVFSLLLDFLRKKRLSGMSVEETSVLMHRAAILRPDFWEKPHDRKWFVMYFFADYIEFCGEQEASNRLDAFLEQGKLPESPFKCVKQTPIKRFFDKIRKLFD